MKILYVDHYAGSLSMGMEFRPYYLAKEWMKMGHEVRIVGADYSHLRIKQPNVQKDFSIESIDGVKYQWLKTIKYNGNGARRAVSIIQFVLKLWFAAKKMASDFNPDVVISSSTYPLDAYACSRIARMAKAKYIHEAHDVWPATLIEMGGMSTKHPFIQLMARAEKYAYKKPEKVVSLLPATKSHMLDCGMQNPDKYVYIPNGIVTEDWKEPETLDTDTQKIYDDLHSKDKFIVGYVGGHALTNALHTLIDAATMMKNNNDIIFILVGKGVEKQKLIEKVEIENLHNILFLPPVKKKQVPSVLFNMDALYIGAAACPLYRFGISMNKLYDYMMSGKPIIYGINAANNEVDEAKCGITIEPESPGSLADAILELKNMDKEELVKLGKNGKNWVLHNREYSKLAKQFVEVMKN